MAVGTSPEVINRLLGNTVTLPSTLKDKEYTPIGINEYGNRRTPFGIDQKTRLKHLWSVGQTGTGKSTLLALMAISDVYAGRGLTVLDPHGELVEAILAHCGARARDVIWLCPADTAWPFALNMIECNNPDEKPRVASSMLDVVKKQYEKSSWGPRLQDIFRNSLYLLLDNPGSTLVELNRLLMNRRTRARLLANCQNDTVRDYFNEVFGSWGEGLRDQAVQPVLNKLGEWLTSPVARNIFG